MSHNSIGTDCHNLRPSTENARRPHELSWYDSKTSCPGSTSIPFTSGINWQDCRKTVWSMAHPNIKC